MTGACLFSDLGPERWDGVPVPDEPRVRRTGCWVTGCGRLHSRTHMVPGRTRDDFLLMYVCVGAGWLELRGRRWTAGPGSLLSCFPHLPHAYGSDPERGWSIVWVHFAGDTAQVLMDQTRLRPERPCLEAVPRVAVEPWFRGIWNAFAAGGPGAALRGSAALYALLAELGAGPAASEQQDALVSAVLAAPTSIRAMARQLDMSPHHFSRRFKASLGISPWQYLTLLRMARAKQLLVDTDWPV
ncbi:MAG: helix-turn-helix domain-containing protein, partial [Planctomycetota bacterium]